jgi:microcystin-dependent protein
MAEAAGQSPIGAMDDYAGRTDPSSNWVICDGRTVPRTGDYATLFSVLVPSLGAATTNGTSTITLNGHGLQIGEQVYFETAVTNVAANTIYWVRSVTTNTFTITSRNPNSSTAEMMSRSAWVSASTDLLPGAGTPVVRSCPYGLGNGTTHFNIPDFRGRVTMGPEYMHTGQGAPSSTRISVGHRAIGRFETGEERHTLTSGESGIGYSQNSNTEGHKHGGATITANAGGGNVSGSANTSGPNSGHGHNWNSNNSNWMSANHSHYVGYNGVGVTVANGGRGTYVYDGGSNATSGVSGTTGPAHNVSAESINNPGDHHNHNSVTIPAQGVNNANITNVSIPSQPAATAGTSHPNMPSTIGLTKIIRLY